MMNGKEVSTMRKLVYKLNLGIVQFTYYGRNWSITIN